MNVREWLSTLDLQDHAPSFEENGVDIALLPELTNEDLKDLGVARLADRKRLLKEIARLGPAETPALQAHPEPAMERGERRQVAILFIDLTGFTELSTRYDPEELHDLVNAFYERVDTVIDRFGGTVDKHLGDGVMALFGAPKAHGDDALRAVRAAFETHDVMAAWNRSTGGNLTVHAGIASGEVVAGGLGRQGKQDYTVLGDSVNLASRLDGMAEPETTLISEAVFKAVERDVDCTFLGPKPVKGIAEPVNVWRAEALRRNDPQARSGAFVGRQGELRQFTTILEACTAPRTGETGTGQVVFLRGEAGIGKSTLMAEFGRLAEERGCVVHRSMVLDFGVGKGHDVLSILMQSLLNLPRADGPEFDARAHRAIHMVTDDPNRRMFLHDLVGLTLPADQRGIFDAMDEATRTGGKKEAIQDVLRHAAAQHARVLMVEDVHWADDASLDLLFGIAEKVGSFPIILLMTTRIEGDPMATRWGQVIEGAGFLTFTLGALPEREALALAGGLADVPEVVARRCVERAEGNPLFLEQLLLNEAESQSEAVPASVQSLVQARIDRLAPRDKDALQAASVLGQRFDLATVHALIEDLDYDGAELVQHLLIRAEGGGYMFTHALIQEGVYTSLLKRRRRDLHAAAAAWFQDRDPLLYAEHLDRAGSPAAPGAYLNAAVLEVQGYHQGRALALVERGLQLAEEPADRFALSLKRAKILQDQGKIALALEAYDQAIEVAQTDTSRCQAWIGKASGLRVEDRYDEALTLLDQAQAVAEREGMACERARIHHVRGNLYFPLGRIEDCVFEHKQSLALAAELEAPEIQADALGGLADADYAAGRMASAHRNFHKCVDLARREGLGRIAVANHSMIGFSRFYLNQMTEALIDAQESIEAAQRTGHRRAEMLGHTLAMFVLVEQGELDTAQDHAQRVLTQSRELHATRFEAQAHMFLGRIARLRGRPEAAADLYETAWKQSQSVGHGFVGARIAGEKAYIAEEAETKRHWLAEGEVLLAAGSVSHNHLIFLSDAIRITLSLRDWAEVERYIEALETFEKAEPLPWCEIIIRYGRLLTRWGEGDHTTQLREELTALQGQIRTYGYVHLDREITAAIG